MSKEIYKLLDLGDGHEYLCSSKEAVRAVIADLTGRDKNDPDVIDAAEGSGSSFSIDTVCVYGRKGLI